MFNRGMRLIERPSPNHNDRPGPVDMLVLHYTGMPTAESALERMCDPAAEVSAHYMIDEAGTVYLLVAEDRRAWHAGLSYWGGQTDTNGRSIGIELVNPGHEFGYLPFPDRQIESLIELTNGILSRHEIPARHVLGHSDVAPARKTDPGEFFPWQRLAEQGIGVWPSPAALQNDAGRDPGDPAALLSAFGYGIPPQVEVSLETVMAAFQRHFRPSCMDGVADAESLRILAALVSG